MGDYKFIYEDFCGVIFTVAGDPTDSDADLKSILVEARKQFIEQFQEPAWKFYLDDLTKTGDLGFFEKFGNTFEKIVTQYYNQKDEIMKNKQLLVDIYSSLINTFIEKVMAFSKLLHENFELYLMKGIKNIVKNSEEMKKIEITDQGLFFDYINLKNIALIELKTMLHDIFEGVVNTGYDVIGDKPINKIIPQVYPIFARKLPDIQQLGVSFPMLQSLINFYYYHEA